MFKEQYWEDHLADSCLDSQMLGVMRTKIVQNCANVRERGGKCVKRKNTENVFGNEMIGPACF